MDDLDPALRPDPQGFAVRLKDHGAVGTYGQHQALLKIQE
jgi:hypothetical protein